MKPRNLEPLLLTLALCCTTLIAGCAGIVTASGPTNPTNGAFQVSPSTVSFGTVVVGKKGTQSVTVTNPGTTSVTISQATVSNPQFSLTGMTLPMTMSAGQSAAITVGVTPTAAGPVSGTLTVTGSSTSSSQAVNLTATAVTAAPQIAVSAPSLNLGSVTVGSTGSSNLIISNTGNADLTVSGVTVSGAGFAASGLVAPKVITAGQTASVSVSFSPTAAGAATGTLSISSSDTANPKVNVGLSGSGTTAPTGQLQANQTALSFGNVATKSGSAKQVVVTNTGTAAASISAVSITGTGFSVSGVTTPATVNPSGQVTLTVTFAPSAAGAVSGTLTVTSNSSGSPLTIPVSGTGVQPTLSLSAASFNFGSVVDGQTKSQSFTITNSGSAALTISQLSISAAGYSVNGLTIPVTVVPAATATFNATFAPTSPGASSGTISIVSNAPNSPATVALSGTGVAPTLTLSFSSTAMNFGNVTTGTTSTITETVTNTGNANVQISLISQTGSGSYLLAGNAVPVTVSPGQHTTFNVVFNPTVTGTASGSVVVTSNATGSPTTISLTGAGVQTVSHTVSLSWAASTSTVNGYNVYRSNTTGTGYVKVNSSLVQSMNYTDSSVQNGTTYFYVTTALDSSGNESVFSNEASAVIP